MAQVGEFAQLDLSDNTQYFVEFLDMVDRAPKMKEVRNSTYKAMDLAPASQVLDVGCGHGTAAIEIARLVGEHGRVEGVDLSDSMVAEAKKRALDRSNVAFRTSDAYQLPYADNTFNATRMERVLLYVKDRERAISEMIRVTKRRGRVVVADVDFESTAIFSKNRLQTRKMTALIADACVHPASGRELPYLLRSAGLEDISVDLQAISTPYEFCFHWSNGALRSAIDGGRVTSQEVTSWLQDLASIEAAGQFFQSWMFTIVSGVVA
jgi:ubiquinone/menaquinone biosynthesis C-methylase UbiE